MTTEEKELVFKDLSARLPYGVIMNYKDSIVDSHIWKLKSLYALSYSKAGTLIDTDWDGNVEYVEYTGCGMSTASRPISLEKNLPYLRPMSSMTEKEKKAFDKFVCIDEFAWNGDTEQGYANQASIMSDGIDWLLSHHFDFRGLIEKGIALEAPKGMYKED